MRSTSRCGVLMPCRFLLERMYDPDFIGNLNGVDHPERIALERQSDLKHARAHPEHRLR